MGGNLRQRKRWGGVRVVNTAHTRRRSCRSAAARTLRLMLPVRSDIREVWTQAWPTVLAMVSYTFMQFVDSLMVSVVGPTEVAAQGNAGIWTWVLISFAFGVTTLVNTLVAQCVGAKQFSRIAAYAWAGLWISLAYWALVLLPSAYVAGSLFEVMGHDAPFIAMERSYAQILLVGGIFVVAGKALSNVFFGLQRPKVITLAAIAGNVVNIVAAFIFIFGEAGMPTLGLPGIPGTPAYGLVGAAIATVLGTAVECIIPFAVLFSARMNRELQIWRAWRPDAAAIREVFSLGWPAGLQFSNEIICWAIFMTVLAGGFGADHMAAGWIAQRFVHMSFMPAVGLSIAATSLVGKHIGERNLPHAVRSAHAALAIALAWMGICGAVFVLFRNELPLAFLASDLPLEQRAHITEIASKILLCAAAFQLLDAVGITYSGALRGAGDTLVPGLVTIVLSWGIIVGGGVLIVRFAPQLESIGPWFAATAYLVVFGVVLGIRFERGGWKRLHLLDAHSSKDASSAP